MLNSWEARKARRPAPVLLVVLHPGGAGLCGAAGEKPPVYPELNAGQIERLCREVLNQPDRNAALRFLKHALPSLETALPGINNEGLVALHELQHGAPTRNDWESARHKAKAAVGQRDNVLLAALGFRIEAIDNLTCLLCSGDKSTALAVMLRKDESHEAGAERFNNLSPISYALNKADDKNLPWVVMVQDNRLRLYATGFDVGVGRRGRTETFIECQPSLLSDEHLPYLWLLYSADALDQTGSLNQILDDSKRFAGDLAKQLRERIYNEVVPALSQGIATVRNIQKLGPEELERTYQMALTVLFRLLFIAYAEDCDLLPYRSNEAYRHRSLKQKAQELAGYISDGTPISKDPKDCSHWQEVSLLWKAVSEGKPEWGVPTYNGGLFTDRTDVSHLGAELAKIILPNAAFEVALRALLVIKTAEGISGPIDFRSLGVREFGTIYEGLLESELACADTDMVLDRRDTYMPSTGKMATAVKSGEIYLHNRSGARKSSGSYYTKHFAVEHLLDGALEPALSDHFTRLGSMDNTDAAETFFDFRVADIAMGSGHFLIAAIDRIEKGMANFLAKRNLPGVRKELAYLRKVANQELGELAETVTIEDGSLLRRLIARRCIYGVDLNALSVQLTQLAVWIHTFVPGLPLSLLDHTLVHGNSLVGIGTIGDIKEKFETTAEKRRLFKPDVEKLLGKAQEPLNRLAKLNDATLQDIDTARKAAREAKEAIGPTKILCDLITARPISTSKKVINFPYEEWEQQISNSDIADAALQDLIGLRALHFPIAFPEVFLRERPGFNVILGNPPWEKLKVEEHAFWARYFPGLRGLPQRQREQRKAQLRRDRPDLVALCESEVAEMKHMRKALTNDTYPGMGTGDPELYKAFCWRFWNLVTTDGGRIGVVLPRNVLSAEGSEKFRQTMLRESASIDATTLQNSGRWVFDDLDPRYSLGLVCIARGPPTKKSIRLRGPYVSLDNFNEDTLRHTVAIDVDQVLEWNDTVSLPLLPSENSVKILAQLCAAPRLNLNKTSQWRARPYRELDATKDKPLMDLQSENCPTNFWPVYKGESFNLWTPDTGTFYAWANPEPVIESIQRKRMHARHRHASPHHEFLPDYLRNKQTLPCFGPRIAFRDVTNRTNQRTIIACLVPPKIFIVHNGPYFLWPRGDKQDQAFLLGVLSSIPFDWYARCFIELHATFYIINQFPVPRPDRSDARWQRAVKLAGRLACPDDRFATWAKAVGVACGSIAANKKEDMIHELDAVIAHLYGLSETQLIHIFETFHRGWNYQSRLENVCRHYRTWAGRR